MTRRRATIAYALTFGLGLACADDGDAIPDDHFACGRGSCPIGELCMIDEDGCSICQPLPEPCVDDEACGCLDTVDATMLPDACVERRPACDDEEGGLVVTCTSLNWACG